MQNNANEMAVFNTAIYVRLSKEDIVAAQSGRESNSITNQKQLILDFLKDKPEFNIVSIRIDDGYTGTNFDRPAFQRMLNDIKAGRINCVVVKDLSRFGREYINSGKYIHRLFPVLGVRLIAINDNIDTITRDESSEFSITLKNLMNDNYSRDISVKVRSQLQVKRKHGDFICPFAPYGYQKCEGNHNRIEPDPYAATVVQDIFNWKIQGMTNNGIAIRLAESGILAPLEYKRHKGEPLFSGFKMKLIFISVSENLHIHIFGAVLGSTGAQPVKTQTILIVAAGIVFVFSAGIKFTENKFPVITTLIGVIVYRYASSVIFYPYGMVFISGNFYFISVTFPCFVYRVAEYFKNGMFAAFKTIGTENYARS